MSPLDELLPFFENATNASSLESDDSSSVDDLFSSLESTIDSINSLMEGLSMEDYVKSNLEVNTERKYREYLSSKGVNPDTLSEPLKIQIQQQQQKYIETVFAVYKERKEQGCSDKDAISALNERSVKWMNNEERVFSQEIAQQLGISSNPRLQQSLNRELTRQRLKTKNEAKKAEITLKTFENILGSVSDVVTLAAEKGCSPSEIDKTATKKEISEDERQTIIDKLIQEDEASKGKKKRKKRRPSKTAHQRKRGKKEPSSSNSCSSSIVKPESKSQLSNESALPLHKRLSRLHPRVKRWAAVKNNEQIRQFTDFDKGGNLVHRYQGLSEKVIESQWIYHNLFGTEKLIADSHDKTVYSFPTNTGCGLMAELIIERRKEYGVIYFGISKEDGVIYHRYFEKIDNNSVSDIFKDQHEEDVDVDSEENLDDGEWESNVKFDFSAHSDGIINFTYPGQKHSVRIFPIRKDLLNKQIF